MIGGIHWTLELLDEYMLNNINAFLSGGDFMPYRQIYQKSALLSGMVRKYVKLNDEKMLCDDEAIAKALGIN